MKKTFYLLCLMMLAFSFAGKVSAQENIVTVPDSIEQPIPTDMIIKESSEAENKKLGWSFEGDSQGAECFDYYKFQSVQVSLGAEKDSYRPGETVTFKGSITNQNDYPVIDGYVFARISQKNPQFMQEGNFIIDEIMPLTNVALDVKEQQKKQFEWIVPQGIASGDYRIDYFFSVGKKFNLGGLPFTNEVIIGTANFSVVDGNSAYISFDRSSSKINDQKYFHIGNWPIIESGKSATITQPLINTFNEAKQATITYDLFYSDSLNEKNKISTKQETVNLAAKETKTLTYAVDNVSRSIYYLRITAVSDGQKSIINLRFLSESEGLALNYPSITKFPLKKGDQATLFSCFYNTSNLAPEGKVIVTLTDKNGQEVAKAEYDGPISSAMAVTKNDFAAADNYGYLKLSAQILGKDGKQIDAYEIVYDCNKLSFDQCKQENMVNAIKETNGSIFNKVFLIVLILTLILIVAIVVIFKRRGTIGGSGIAMLFLIMAVSIGILAIPQNALAYNERSTSPSAPFEVSYVYAAFDTGSWTWACYGVLNIIKEGNTSVTHTVGMTRGGYTVDINQPINFAYGEPIMFFNGTAGPWQTPYGEWRNDLNSYNPSHWNNPYYTLKGESSRMRNPSNPGENNGWGAYHNKFEAMFTGVKPAGTYMTSSNPSVISCSGMNCTSKTPGAATLTAHIPATQTRVWSRFQIGDINNAGWVYAHEPLCWPSLGVCYPHNACVIPGSCSCSSSGANILPIPAATVSWNVTVTAPINGVCSVTHYNCSKGTLGATAEYSDQWQWWCNGSGGGSNILCSEMKLPTASCSVSPNPIAYGGNPGITLNSTNGYYCHVYNDWREVQSGYFTSGTYYPGAQTTPGVHQGEVYCYNSAWVGSGWSTCNYTVSPPPAPTLTFTGTYGSQVNQTTLNLQSGPGDVTLNWTTNASTTFCDAWGGDATWDAYNPASAGGSSVRTVPATLTYYMECWNAVNVSTGVKTVQVNVCNPNCSDSDSHCQSTTYTGNCGQTCDGTLPNSCGGWGSCSKECGGGVQIQDCVCPTKTKTRSCSSRPCPPSYKEVAPW